MKSRRFVNGINFATIVIKLIYGVYKTIDFKNENLLY